MPESQNYYNWNCAHLVNMAEPAGQTVLPIREGEDEKKAAAEQEINPWDVQAAIDEHGNALAFDYEAISKYVYFRSN